MTPEQVAVAMPQVETHVAMGLLAFPARLVAGRKMPLYRGWQSTEWDLGMLQVELGRPDVNYYGLTQAKSNPRRLIVMDVDDGAEGVPPGGLGWQDRLDDIVVKYGAIPFSKTTRTPSGGEHAWWIWPDDVPLPGGSWHGFTVRSLLGAKNWVAGPGSVHPNGTPYVDVWPDEPLGVMPSSLARSDATATKTATLITVTGGDGYWLPESIDHGACHLEVCRYTLSLWNKGLSSEEMWACVLALLGPRLATPHTEAHLWRHFKSATTDIERKGRPQVKRRPRRDLRWQR